MNYAIITENETSQWKDETGTKYHFPSKYYKILQPGTQVIYYKGKLKDAKFKTLRLSNDPHYFGLGSIGRITKDTVSNKNDFFAEVKDFIKFTKPVSFKSTGGYIEPIANKKTNYWRDGVRLIDNLTFEKIKSLAHIDDANKSVYNDFNIVSPSLESEFLKAVRNKFLLPFSKEIHKLEHRLLAYMGTLVWHAV